MARIVGLEEPALSPDARTVALVVVRQDVAQATYPSRIELFDARAGKRVATIGPDGASVPRWAPDGTRLAYLARPKAGAVQQLYVRGQGGRTAQLTHAAADVIDAAWSPDGRWLAFVAFDAPANAQALAAHHDYFFAGDNDYTATALAAPAHLWVVPAGGGAERRLTSGSWTIAPTDPGGIFSPQITWARDGGAIVITRAETTFPGDNENTTIWSVDVRTRALRKLTSHPNVELSPSFSPDGSRLAYWYARDGNFAAENTVRLRAGGADETLASAFDLNVAGAIWYPDSRHMLYCATEHTANGAWRVALDGAMRALPLSGLNMECESYQSGTFDSGVAASIARDGTIAFLADDARHLRELYLLAPNASAPRRLTHFNDFIASLDTGEMTELPYDGPGGFHEYGVVTKPPNARDGVRYPVVALIHGGPGLSSIRQFGYEQWPLAQEIAARGYVVFQPNYRGSDNIGNAFMLAIVGDSAEGPGNDVLAGLAELEKQPFVDASRVGVSGWSYGGKLTSWLIGHSSAFRAAVSGAAVNDEFEEYALSTSNVQDRYLLGAAPYTGDGWKIYADQSPISYYANIKTPTLIWGTTLDPVVPVPQAYALYHALHDNGVPVKLLIFPASTHGPSNPVQTADLTRFWIDWLDRYLK